MCNASIAADDVVAVVALVAEQSVDLVADHPQES
jgi:hypothetical protein